MKMDVANEDMRQQCLKRILQLETYVWYSQAAKVIQVIPALYMKQ